MEEIDIKLHFCPECHEEKSRLSKFCGSCGTKIKAVEVIVCMEGNNVDRLLLKRSS